MTRLLAGNIAGCVAACLFGGAVVATRVAVRDVPPLSLAVLRFGQGALILLAVLLLRSSDLPPVDRRDRRFLVLLGFLLFALFPTTFNAGLDRTTASRGAVMLATFPLWSAILARAMGRERLTRRQLGGVLLSVAGVAIVFLEDGLVPRGGTTAAIGNGLMLLTALCLAVHGVLAKPVLARYPALLVTAYTMAIGTMLLLPIALAEGLPRAVTEIDGRLALLLLFLGIGGGALPHVLTAFALARLSPTQTAVYTNLNPLVATALAALLLSEPITATFALGFAAVVAGLLLVNWPKRRVPERVRRPIARPS